jgi:hypothetical protein
MRPADPSYAHLYAIRSASADPQASVRAIRESFAASINSRDDCRGSVVLHESMSSTLLLVSLWDTAAVGQASFPTTAEILPHSGVYEVAQWVGTPGGAVARVYMARLKPDPDAVERAVTLFQNIVMHAATAQGGFQRGLLLVDRESFRAVSIGIWTTASDLLTSEERGYLTEQLAHFTNLLAEPPLRLTPDVLAEE